MLNKQDILDRRIRAAIREYDDLMLRRFTVIKLSQPIQRGWRRFFVLSEHAERRKDRETLAAILAIIGTERRCRRPDFRTRGYRNRRLIDIEQSVRRIGDREWERQNFPSNWFRYFHVHFYSEWGRPAFRAEFAHPALFELRIEPHWIWEVRELDPAIETRLEELRRWFELSGAWSLGVAQGPARKLAVLLGCSGKISRPGAPPHHPRCDAREVDPAASMQRRRISLLFSVKHFPRRSPMQRQRAQTSSSAGATPAAGTICGTSRHAVCVPRPIGNGASRHAFAPVAQ